MCPQELWLFIDAKTPEKRYGNLSQSDVEELYQLNQELEATSEDGN